MCVCVCEDIEFKVLAHIAPVADETQICRNVEKFKARLPAIRFLLALEKNSLSTLFVLPGLLRVEELNLP